MSINDPTCVCGHRRNQHSRGGGCLAMVQQAGPVLPAYMACACNDYVVSPDYTSEQLAAIKEAGKHVI